MSRAIRGDNGPGLLSVFSASVVSLLSVVSLSIWLIVDLYYSFDIYIAVRYYLCRFDALHVRVSRIGGESVGEPTGRDTTRHQNSR